MLGSLELRQYSVVLDQGQEAEWECTMVASRTGSASRPIWCKYGTYWSHSRKDWWHKFCNGEHKRQAWFLKRWASETHLVSILTVMFFASVLSFATGNSVGVVRLRVMAWDRRWLYECWWTQMLSSLLNVVFALGWMSDTLDFGSRFHLESKLGFLTVNNRWLVVVWFYLLQCLQWAREQDAQPVWLTIFIYIIVDKANSCARYSLMTPSSLLGVSTFPMSIFAIILDG